RLDVVVERRAVPRRHAVGVGDRRRGRALRRGVGRQPHHGGRDHERDDQRGAAGRLSDWQHHGDGGLMSYTVRGVTALTATTIDTPIFSVWNPHATQRIKLIQWGVFKTGAGAAGDALRLRRISTRGTAGSTVTPVIAHHSENAIAPPSGFLLDLAQYTVQ